MVLTINGVAREFDLRPQATLLDALESAPDLAGTREGCGIGVCGACTVLMEGQAISACLLLAVQARGRAIVTIEGLAPKAGPLDPVQRAFAEANAFQCSFCTPGFVLATHALLRDHPRFDAPLARHYLAGNLCRCGSYVKIMQAVLSLAPR